MQGDNNVIGNIMVMVDVMRQINNVWGLHLCCSNCNMGIVTGQKVEMFARHSMMSPSRGRRVPHMFTVFLTSHVTRTFTAPLKYKL